VHKDDVAGLHRSWHCGQAPRLEINEAATPADHGKPRKLRLFKSATAAAHGSSTLSVTRLSTVRNTSAQ
jgi:hypothetical protein